MLLGRKDRDIMELSVEPVTKGNRAQVLALAVAEEQKGFVETPAQCLEEASRLGLWRPVALCTGGEIVGFAMYGRFPREGTHGRVWLDRLLIDRRHQGKGYGAAAVDILCRRLQKEYACDRVFLSCYPHNKAAIALYEKKGFCFNGEKDINGEDVMVRQLA